MQLNTSGFPRAPLDTARAVTRLAFGSCNKHDAPQAYWARVAQRRPDVWVWLGDVVYADVPVLLKLRLPASAERLKAHWDGQLASAHYRAFSAATPVLGIYDDHDYGQNDGDKRYNATARALSQQFLWDFVGEPAGSPRRAQEGVYQHYVLGAAPRRVHLILLDGRTNRDPYDDAAGRQDMLGAAQWAWLEAVLRDTDAEVTVIGSGVQVLSRGDPWIAEMWYKLPESQAKLLALLAKTGVQGAFFLSGDVHFAELNRQLCPPVGYPLYDLTSSGLTHSWGGPVKPLGIHLCTMGACARAGRARARASGWACGGYPAVCTRTPTTTTTLTSAATRRCPPQASRAWARFIRRKTGGRFRSTGRRTAATSTRRWTTSAPT
jgi:alkaline phosphatase D